MHSYRGTDKSVPYALLAMTGEKGFREKENENY